MLNSDFSNQMLRTPSASPLPREHIERELAELSESNNRIRFEIEAVRSRLSPELPRTESLIEEQPASAVFGTKGHAARRFWGLEEQLKENLKEPSSDTPLPTRDSSTYYEAVNANEPQITEPTFVSTSGEISSSKVVVGKEDTVVFPSSYSYKEPNRFIQGLRALDHRERPMKKVRAVLYDKDTMSGSKSNAKAFVEWILEGGYILDGDIIQHLVPMSSFSGVLNHVDFLKNEDLLGSTFPDLYPYWLEYSTKKIPFEIVFLEGNLRQLYNDIQKHHPAILICPSMPHAHSELNRILLQDISTPIMFAQPTR